MTKDEIKFLQSCGFTISEIMAMHTGADTSAHETLPDPPSIVAAADSTHVQEEQPAKDPVPEDPPVTGQDLTQAVDQTALNSSFNNMMDDFRKMFEQQLGLIQSANLRNAVQKEEQEKTPEDLIANIIHPTMKERRR